MHNHLLTYEQYICEQSILNHAIEELDRVINDKLLVNDSTYSNSTNIMEVLGGMVVLVGAAAMALNKFAHSETGQNFIKGLEVLGKAAYKSTLLLNNNAEEIVADDSDESE